MLSEVWGLLAHQLAGLAELGPGEAWLRAVCWENPVATSGMPGS